MHRESEGGNCISSARSSVFEEQLLMDSFGGEEIDEENGNDI